MWCDRRIALTGSGHASPLSHRSTSEEALVGGVVVIEYLLDLGRESFVVDGLHEVSVDTNVDLVIEPILDRGLLPTLHQVVLTLGLHLVLGCLVRLTLTKFELLLDLPRVDENTHRREIHHKLLLRRLASREC